jgi:hypothetical protein
MGLLVKFGDFVFWWLKKNCHQITNLPVHQSADYRREHQIPTKGFIYLHDIQSYLNRTHVI